MNARIRSHGKISALIAYGQHPKEESPLLKEPSRLNSLSSAIVLMPAGAAARPEFENPKL
jgi:hypothetical protein